MEWLGSTGMWGAVALMVGAVMSTVATVVTVRERRRSHRDELEHQITAKAQLAPLEGWERLSAGHEAYAKHLLVELERNRSLLILSRDEITRLRDQLDESREGQALLHADLVEAQAEAARVQGRLDDALAEIGRLHQSLAGERLETERLRGRLADGGRT